MEKHNPYFSPSFSPSSSRPRLVGTRRTSWRGTLTHRLRMIFIFIAGCLIFFAAQSVIGVGVHRRVPGTTETIPKKIWQSWKVDALRFEQRDSERAISWTTLNKAHRYEVLTDDGAMTYVLQHYGPSGLNRPDIVKTYSTLTARVIQADLLRYLIMYAEGGLWADIDVEALRPIERFIPKNRYDEKEIDMIVGVETDEPDFKDHPILGSKAQSLCQWSFAAKPRLPVMLRLIENILAWLNRLSIEQGRSIGELEFDFDEVLSGTGPSAFTEAILAEMSITTGRKVTWDEFHELSESKVVGGVLVLPSEAFAAGTGHSDSGNHAGQAALVKHHFHASGWTTNHPRYKHPIFGEVEKCNWDRECVDLYDLNIQFFSSLPEEDQLKMIALAQLDEREKAAKSKSAEVIPAAATLDDGQLDMGPPAGLPPTDPLAALSDARVEEITDQAIAEAKEGKQALPNVPGPL